MLILFRHSSSSILILSVVVSFLIPHGPILIEQCRIIGPDDLSSLSARLQLVLKQVVLQFLSEEILDIGDVVEVIELDVAISAESDCELFTFFKVRGIDVFWRGLLGLKVTGEFAMVTALHAQVVNGAETLQRDSVGTLTVGNTGEDGHTRAALDAVAASGEEKYYKQRLGNYLSILDMKQSYPIVR